jgi:cytoskeletal protein RodZ
MSKPVYKIGSPTQYKGRKNKALFIGIPFLLILLGASTAFLIVRRNNQQNQTNDTKAQDEAQTESAKSSAASEENSVNSANLPSNSSSLTTNQVPTSSAMTVQISNFSQSNGTVNATATIAGSSKAGTCVFSFNSPEDRPVIKQVPSTLESCSVSIPEVEFSRLGSWKLTVTLYVDNAKAEATQNVTIN